MDDKNERLTEIFSEVGKKHGYKEVEASYTAFRDMKVKWCRSYNWIRFDVSDYLMDAPDDVTASIADTIFSRIKGEESTQYSEDVAEWVSSGDFVREKQPTYVNRCRGLTLSPKGDHRDLAESYDRLVGRGLLDRDPDVYLGWGPAGTGRHSGFSSVLMKVVNMSSILDDESVPEEVLDYCLYAQLAHITMGFDPFTTRRGEEYEELLAKYPEREEAELLMKQHNIKL